MEKAVDRLSSADIASALAEMEDAPWGDIQRGRPLDARGMARRLRPFGIRPEKVPLAPNSNSRVTSASGSRTYGIGISRFCTGQRFRRMIGIPELRRPRPKSIRRRIQRLLGLTSQVPRFPLESGRFWNVRCQESGQRPTQRRIGRRSKLGTKP